MKLRIREYLRSPLGIWYRICAECANAFLQKESLPSFQLAAQVDRGPEVINRILSDYWAFDAKNIKTSVVYTCITNDYDDISAIAIPSFVNREWDYVCFTDNQEAIRNGRVGVWKIRPLVFTQSDDTRNNRWHKFHPDLLFPNYAESIYIDANIDILTDWVFEESQCRNVDLLMPLHPIRKCIFQEYKMIMSQFMDDPTRILAERRIIQASGMPRNYGMTENNVIYRKHHKALVRDMMRECWDMLMQFSKRDQLCMSWILWKHGIDVKDIAFPCVRQDSKNFRVFQHPRRKVVSVPS